MDARELEKRIGELESQATFQDELHQQLNAVIARQDQEIQQLKTAVTELARRVAQTQEAVSNPAGPADEVPPHY